MNSTLPPLPQPNVPKAALVTGAAHRIGRAVALGLAADGYAVALHCHRSAADAEALAGEIAQAGGKAVTLQADLAVEAEVGGLIAQATAALGPLGILVNNASLFERDEALTTTRESWDAHMEPNLRAPFVLSQDFARQLPAAASGVIVNLLDERVLNLTPHFTSYTLSKAGLWTLTQTLALALAPRIRVVGIGPGPVLPSPHQSDAQFIQQYSSMPLQRPSSPDEILGAVRFILATPSMTGQVLLLDSGQHLGWSQPRGEPPF
ncbi:MAG TPA: SDR family oxidoreductase [Alphaproteobacteria bacterium]|jgi:NAD(P)-dependent dehydrogenase (short-subunit alcohol dehydrogenase family)